MSTVFVTKYALGRGILECKLGDVSGEMATVEWPGGLNGVAYFHEGDWHRDIHSAAVRAESMRVSKIASLKKSISKFEKMNFFMKKFAK